MSQSNRTYIRVVEGEGDNAELVCVTEKQFNESVEAAKKYNAENPTAEPKVVPEAQLIQTFGFYEVANDAEFASLVPDEAERANIVNRALVLKEQAAVRRLITDEDFQMVEGVYDLAEICAKPTERKAADPVSKVKGLLSKLSPEQIAEIMAELASAGAAA